MGRGYSSHVLAKGRVLQSHSVGYSSPRWEVSPDRGTPWPGQGCGTLTWGCGTPTAWDWGTPMAQVMVGQVMPRVLHLLRFLAGRLSCSLINLRISISRLIFETINSTQTVLWSFQFRWSQTRICDDQYKFYIVYFSWSYSWTRPPRSPPWCRCAGGRGREAATTSWCAGHMIRPRTCEIWWDARSTWSGRWARP